MAPAELPWDTGPMTTTDETAIREDAPAMGEMERLSAGWAAAAAKLRAVEALADRMAAVPDYTATTYDQGRVDQRHDDEAALREVLEGA